MELHTEARRELREGHVGQDAIGFLPLANADQEGQAAAEIEEHPAQVAPTSGHLDRGLHHCESTARVFGLQDGREIVEGSKLGGSQVVRLGESEDAAQEGDRLLEASHHGECQGAIQQCLGDDGHQL